jgi:hypothetical protein
MKNLILLLSLLVPLAGFAQSYSINWYKIAGGGGTSAGGIYSVSGTAGQPDATTQTITGGAYSLTGGFWAFLGLVQTPGAPLLSISLSGRTVTASWQDTHGWTLQQNSNLGAAAGWSATSGVTTSNGTNYLSITGPAGSLFFRLKGQ